MKTPITRATISDFLECGYRAYLELTASHDLEPCPDNLREHLQQQYHARACGYLRTAHGSAMCMTGASLATVLAQRLSLAFDVSVSDGDVVAHCDVLMVDTHAPYGTHRYIPVIFAFEEEVRKEHKMQLALCALALINQHVSVPFGRVIYGACYSSAKVQLGVPLRGIESLLQEIRALQQASSPPAIHWTRQCAVCRFEQICHATLAAKDSLRLLGGIKPKEIAQLEGRGIQTITQLSYMFRPRKKSRRANPNRVRYYHSLRALALREKKIHIAGSLQLPMTGTPVYLDVEGVPDRQFYYLIGLRIPNAGSSTQVSLWADDPAGEESIWRGFLEAVSKIENPQLFHYGSYESQFFRRMKKRYGGCGVPNLHVDRLIECACNVVSVMYGHIYFPTYSNSLKEVASFLGQKWAMGNPSGQRAMLLRRGWEMIPNASVKQSLVAYNADDCEALERVVTTILQLASQSGAPSAATSSCTVHVDSLAPHSPYSLGPVKWVISELDHINKCAYWDYQRDRIYIRSNPGPRRSRRKRQARKRRTLPVNKRFVPSRHWKCPRCASERIRNTGRHSRLVHDLRITSGGVKRWVSQYFIDHYQCRHCGGSFPSDEHDVTSHRYGLVLLAYVIHNIIELHIPQLKLSRIMETLFGYRLGQPTVNGLKRRAAALYRETFDDIKRTLLGGSLIHADETHMGLKSGAGYVWVFTSMHEVVYLWSPTREGDVAKNFLADFHGVLVSDFYAAYDAVDCPQQRCLIHLIRDMNDLALKEPFNNDVKMIVHDFAALLTPMVETIDRFGLRRHYLHKHKKAVACFYKKLLAQNCCTEAGKQIRDRFRRQQDRLFTFLDFDGVPWNNNNAEHAIRAFSGLRSVIEANTNERGIEEYLMLLSICQTCAYRGMGFLDFLRSNEKRLVT